MNNEYECRYLFQDNPKRQIVQRCNRESKSFFTDEQLSAVPIINKRSQYGNYPLPTKYPVEFILIQSQTD